MNARPVVLAGSLLVGCGRTDRTPTPEVHSSTPADTLVLTNGPYQIWLAEGRAAADSAGQSCYERSVDVRTDSTRTKVPLLYVLDPPTVFDRDHLRAVLSYRCRPMAVYRIELATGRPFKIEDR